jgi:multiple sugar transport system permease protein
MSGGVGVKERGRGTGAIKASLSYALLAALTIPMLLPLAWMIGTSLKAPGESMTAFLPEGLHFHNYYSAATAAPFARFFVNSLAVAFVVTIGQVYTSAMAGYAFARIRFPGRNALFLAYLATMMIPQAVTLVPLFMMLTKLPGFMDGLFGTTFFSDGRYFLGRLLYVGRHLGVDSYFVLIVPALFSPYGTFLLRQFFIAIPRELEEAAEIDGASRWLRFRTIILPISKPALATLATFTFMNTWRTFLWPLVMTEHMEMKTLPVGLMVFLDFHGGDWPLLMAATTMMLAPMIVVFLFCQRWFISGIQLGALKG